MELDARELRELVVEQRLLRDVLRLTRRCDGPAPRGPLDAVLAGTSGVRPVLPAQRSSGSA
jgi:hypothetical protein